MIIPLQDSTVTDPNSSELKAPAETEGELPGEAVRQIFLPLLS